MSEEKTDFKEKNRLLNDLILKIRSLIICNNGYLFLDEDKYVDDLLEE